MEIDWKNLGFGYIKTDFNIRSVYKDGEWSKLEVSSSEFFNIHIAATGLHYGQEAFEGLKAYMGKDKKIRVFRVDENAKRMISSARGIRMAEVPVNLFREAVIKAVSLNKKFIPPYGTGAALYIRPLLFGSGAEVGVKQGKEYTFLVFVTPVGPYFKEGFRPGNIMICRDSDRAAPLGTGNIKVGGNYAASLNALHKAHELGYSTVLYLDSKEKKYIDECGPANFFGIKGNSYITPDSVTILPSITNKSLQELAIEMGMKVEKRQITVDELGEFDEVGACGTAAVITPIGKIIDIERNITYTYCSDGNPGPVSSKLYNLLTSIQYGDKPDKFGWNVIVD